MAFSNPSLCGSDAVLDEQYPRRGSPFLDEFGRDPQGFGYVLRLGGDHHEVESAAVASHEAGRVYT